RVRHRRRSQLDESVVEPGPYERARRRRLGLGDLVLVMRKDEILAPSVEVEALPQIAHRHGRALDVPARPARPPRARPGGLIGLRRLPQGTVERVALAL